MDHAVSLWWQKGDQTFKHIAVIQPGATSGMTTYPGPSTAHKQAQYTIIYAAIAARTSTRFSVCRWVAIAGHRWVASAEQSAATEPSGPLFAQFAVRKPHRTFVVPTRRLYGWGCDVEQILSQDVGTTKQYHIDGKAVTPAAAKKSEL